MPGVIGRSANTVYMNYLRCLIKTGKKCHLETTNKKVTNALVTPVRIVHFNGKYKLNYYYQNFSKINSINIDEIANIKATSTGLV